ncbi:MAG TPA: GNAT family N-acetyltransferase [Candidatus Magasanikbacteria bacterium]|nr:MAG: GNAT family N-acetyltransferase [Candidatus Magasanikbacteria bacterium RIFOXYC2_FULL_39_8]HAT03485.1 GNAT family N-acetyltransferase [Candidatus Magasanikbacteria bacterium]
MEITQETQHKSFAIRFSAQEDGKEVGRAYLYIIYNDLHEEPYGLMEDVFVDEKYRGSGVGTQLVYKVIGESRTQGCRKLVAQSRYSKDSVHALYKKLGFTDHGKNFRMDFFS